MTSPWGKIAAAAEPVSFTEIMSEEYAHRVQDEELRRYEKKTQQKVLKDTTTESIWKGGDSGAAMSYSQAAKQEETTKTPPHEADAEEWEDYSALLGQEHSVEHEAAELPGEVLEAAGLESDAVIAAMLQSQFDHEYNEELCRIERQRNKQSKITVTLDKFRQNGDLEFLQEPLEPYEDEEDETARQKRDWDRFETNEKKLETIPKRGFKVDKEGEMITKHNEELCNVRNACRVMSFPPEFPTGDGAGFDMKLSNQVFNQLKTYSRRTKKNNMNDRKAQVATAEMGVDERTRLLLYKLINNQILEQINGIISTGKEALILHANSDPAYTGASEHGGRALLPPHLLPKECAIKIFKTTLNEFKQRDRYIKDDYRFRARFSKQNNRTVINMWAEKEMHNMMRMQSVGVRCPDVVVLKNHVLVMSFIGDNHNAAPKLKDAKLSAAELSCAYEEIVSAMYTLYNEAKLVHADLSEYNILWHEGKCWFIDVAQAVEPGHPSALEFLMRDCGNIINFFTKRGLPNIFTKEQLFEHITALNAETHNVAMLERIHTRGATVKEATAPNREHCPDELRPIDYPFDLAWQKSQIDREQAALELTAKAMQELSTNCSTETGAAQQKEERKVKVESKHKNKSTNNTAQN